MSIRLRNYLAAPRPKEVSTPPKRFASRKIKIQQRCQNFRQPLSDTEIRSIYKRMVVDDRHKVIYCPVWKSGSNSWRITMRVLKGDIKTLEEAQKFHQFYLTGLTTLGTYTDSSAIEFRLKNYTKFTSYREPIDRFAADYLMMKIPNSPQRGHLQKAVDYVDREKVGVSSPRGVKNATITDFGRYVSRFGNDSRKLYRLNFQWYPQNLACHPCHFDYDYLIDMDSPTVSEDSYYLLKMIGAPEWLKMLHRNPTQNDKTSILSQLPEDVYQSLLSVYYNDYEIFGYKRRDWKSLNNSAKAGTSV
jgi:hypothetical protein